MWTSIPGRATTGCSTNRRRHQRIMNNLTANYQERARVQIRSGLTLIELIAVLAILAIFAAAILPIFVRQMDKTAADQESAYLKTFAGGLQQSILRNRYIPGTNDWSTVIAAEAGKNLSAITTNDRNRARYFLIDPSLNLSGTAGLPYSQGIWGSTNVISPRLMLLSSIGPALTAAPAGSDFNAIWNWTDGSATPPTNAVFANIKKGDDVRVQRIELTPLFVQLGLTTNGSSDQAFFSVSTGSTTTQTTNVPASGLTNYYLVSTVLGLYTNGGTGPLDSQQILTRASSYIYDGSIWRNAILNAYATGNSSGGGSGVSIASSAYSIVTNFLAAPPNYGSGASNQAGVVQAMIDYMNAYDAWAGSKFTNTTFYNTAVAKQAILAKAANGLCCSPIPPEHLAP